MVIHLFFAVVGLLGIVEGIEVIKSNYKKRGWITLMAGILAILISLEQCVLFLFFEWPGADSVAFWSSSFMYNIAIFNLGILFFFLGINLVKTGGPLQKMKGIVGIIAGVLMTLLSFLEILLG